MNYVPGYTARRSSAGFLQSPQNRPLIAPGYLDPRFTFTRAQASGARSTALAFDGTTTQEFDADVPRFNGATQRLLIEAQRTNIVENPRLEGVALGAFPGTGSFPNGFAIVTAAPTEIVGFGQVDGLPYFDVRYNGTTTINFAQMRYLPTGTIPFTEGRSLTHTIYVAHVGGTLTNVLSMSLVQVWTNGTPAAVSGFTPTSTLTRYQMSAVSPIGTTGLGVGAVRVNWTTGVNVDVTIRYALPSVEEGAFASTPILPAVGTPAASTRGADLPVASLASLGITGPGAIYGVSMLPQSAPTGINQFIAQVDVGNNLDVYRIFNFSGTNNIRVQRVTASAVATASSGDMTPGAPFGWCLAWDNAGAFKGLVSGGVIAAGTGGPTGMTTLRVGHNAAGIVNLSGEQGVLFAVPGYPSDAEMQSRVAALPI